MMTGELRALVGGAAPPDRAGENNDSTHCPIGSHRYNRYTSVQYPAGALMGLIAWCNASSHPPAGAR